MPKSISKQTPIPATSELFTKEAMIERHPNFLTRPRIEWALRNRARNGLENVVYESKSGQLLIDESGFLRWYLGLTGRAKPRGARTPSIAADRLDPVIQIHRPGSA
jgi:hypothetical protein